MWVWRLVLLDWRLGTDDLEIGTVGLEVGYDSGCISGGATGGR